MATGQSEQADAARKAAADGPKNARPVRWAYPVCLALPLIVLNCGWIAYGELRANTTWTTIPTLFMGVTFMLFVVTLLNLAVRRWRGPSAALSQPEMMLLYTLLSMSSVVAGIGNFGFFTPFLGNVFHDATPSNGWQSFWPLLPSSIGPRDPDVLRGFYEGHSTFFQKPIMAAWAYPLIVWSVFFLLLLWTTLCLSVILRHRWADEEHLPFPVIALPLEMTREGAPLYKSRLLWGGFAIPFCVHSLNTFHGIYPTLPYLPMKDLQDLAPTLAYPWTGVDSLFYLLHPVGVGFGYLINTDASFSLWFFYLLKKLLNVWGVTEGWRDPGHGWFGDTAAQFPYTGYQGMGAWLVLGLTTLGAGRTYFRAYLGRALHGDKEGVDRDEPLSARAALLGLLVGFLLLCGLVWSAGGSWWLPIAFLGIYLLLMVALSRIRAETAVLCTELVWINPQTILPLLTGTSGLSHTDLAHMGMLSWFNTDYRAAGMPHELEGLVGQGHARGSMRALIPTLLAVSAFAMAAALVWDLQMYYTQGAATAKTYFWVVGKGSEPWQALASWLHNPKPPDGVAFTGMAVGAGVTLLMASLRTRFLSFPFVPAAYALNASFANDFFWCDMFVAWLLKVLIVRYGGISLYRQAMPFFLGLILGDFVTGAAWSIVQTCLHLDLYRSFAV